MKQKTFETELPEGYTPALTIDAGSRMFTIWANIAAFAVVVVLFALDCFLIHPWTEEDLEFSLPHWLLLCLVMLAYIVLHELTHGAAYKLLTGHKLTFGLSATVAYCGVPDIYVYRRTALISLLAPFTVFTIVFGLGMVLLPGIWLRFSSGFLLALHLSGCVGDLYDTFILMTKLTDSTILMQDTGPVQTFYKVSRE